MNKEMKVPRREKEESMSKELPSRMEMNFFVDKATQRCSFSFRCKGRLPFPLLSPRHSTHRWTQTDPPPQLISPVSDSDSVSMSSFSSSSSTDNLWQKMCRCREDLSQLNETLSSLDQRLERLARRVKEKSSSSPST